MSMLISVWKRFEDGLRAAWNAARRLMSGLVWGSTTMTPTTTSLYADLVTAQKIEELVMTEERITDTMIQDKDAVRPAADAAGGQPTTEERETLTGLPGVGNSTERRFAATGLGRLGDSMGTQKTVYL